MSIGRDGQLQTSIYDKRDDFNFHITNFPFLSSNIPTSPAYGVFISQLIRYARACSSYDVLSWGRRDFQISFSNRDTSRNAWSRHWEGRYGDLTKQYKVSLSQMLDDIMWPEWQWQPSTDHTLYRTVCGMPTGDAYSSRHLVPSLWDLHMFYLLRPILFPNLSLFLRTMLFEYPSALTRFCYINNVFFDDQLHSSKTGGLDDLYDCSTCCNHMVYTRSLVILVQHSIITAIHIRNTVTAMYGYGAQYFNDVYS